MKLVEDEISGNWIVSVSWKRWEDFFEWFPKSLTSVDMHNAMQSDVSDWLRENARLGPDGGYLPLYSIRSKEMSSTGAPWKQENLFEFHFYRREIAMLFMLTWADFNRFD